jgi:UDP:flavonoid glycosyltransferase YjiC (YdhE family)
MGKILYAWELGADFGHVSAFLPVARRLREHGHDVMLAVKDVALVESVLGRDGWPVFQAPVWRAKVSGLPEPILTYGDLLLRAGFIDKTVLAGLAKGWRHFYAMTEPDLLILDHGPRALLAAYGLRIPCALTGNGYFVPPPVSPLPNMQPWINVSADRLQVGEKAALQVANEVLHDLGVSPLEAITDLFRVEENFLCTYPELDPFHKSRGSNVHYWGPITVAEWGVRPSWPESQGKKIFAYLKSRHSDFEKILQALAESPNSVVVYATGASDEIVAKYTSSKLHFSNEPIDMAYAQDECHVAVCHAGHGTTTRMLLAGRPLLLLPNNVEQILRALTVQELEAGLAVIPGKTAPDYRDLLNQLTENELFTEKARAFADRHGDFDPEVQLNDMVERCEEMMAGDR